MPFYQAVGIVRFPGIHTGRTLGLYRERQKRRLPDIRVVLSFPGSPKSSLDYTTCRRNVHPYVIRRDSNFGQIDGITVHSGQGKGFLLGYPGAIMLDFSVRRANTYATVGNRDLGTAIFDRLNGLFTIAIFQYPTNTGLRNGEGIRYVSSLNGSQFGSVQMLRRN